MTELQSREAAGDDSMMGQAQQQVQEKAEQARGLVTDQVQQQVDQRSTQVGEQLRTVSEALRRTGKNLRSEGNEAPAKVTESVSDRLEQLAAYLTDSNADKIFRELEQAARRRPWAFAGGGLVLGLIASRFLKASSHGRYQSSNGKALPAGDEPEVVFEPDVEIESPVGVGHGS